MTGPRDDLEAKVLAGPGDLPALDADVARLGDALARRIHADPDDAARGLVTLVLGLVESLRRVMEREALERLDAGDLTEDQVERVGLTLMRLEQRMVELRAQFGLDEGDLSLDLGPWGRLR